MGCYPNLWDTPTVLMMIVDTYRRLLPKATRFSFLQGISWLLLWLRLQFQRASVGDPLCHGGIALRRAVKLCGWGWLMGFGDDRNYGGLPHWDFMGISLGEWLIADYTTTTNHVFFQISGAAGWWNLAIFWAKMMDFWIKQTQHLENKPFSCG